MATMLKRFRAELVAILCAAIFSPVFGYFWQGYFSRGPVIAYSINVVSQNTAQNVGDCQYLTQISLKNTGTESAAEPKIIISNSGVSESVCDVTASLPTARKFRWIAQRDGSIVANFDFINVNEEVTIFIKSGSGLSKSVYAGSKGYKLTSDFSDGNEYIRGAMWVLLVVCLIYLGFLFRKIPPLMVKFLQDADVIIKSLLRISDRQQEIVDDFSDLSKEIKADLALLEKLKPKEGEDE